MGGRRWIIIPACAILLTGCASSLRVRGNVDNEFDRLTEQLTVEDREVRLFERFRAIEGDPTTLFYHDLVIDRPSRTVTLEGGRWMGRHVHRIRVEKGRPGEVLLRIDTETGWLWRSSDTDAGAYLAAYLNTFVYDDAGTLAYPWTLSRERQRFIDDRRAQWRAQLGVLMSDGIHAQERFAPVPDRSPLGADPPSTR